ncbi:COMM domain-containing protein 6-like [Liolophura sinensis]|uniref:COMM domain-containing protein 6-like n=1 Tax=Liolophura sinensis TaxID=3198878 RepID=UPI00315824B9
MAAIVQNAPQGTGKAADLLNQLPEDILAEMCQDVMRVLQYKLSCVNIKSFTQKINSVSKIVEDVSVQSCVNAVTYLYREAARSDLNSENLSKQLASSSLFKRNVVDVLCRIWEQQGRLLSSSDVTQLLNVGQLVDMKWKLGVAMSSDCCRNLNVPYVTITLVIADTSGKQLTNTIEMSVTEFQKFSNQMKEIGSVLETV